jgi:hypothetical protein
MSTDESVSRTVDGSRHGGQQPPRRVQFGLKTLFVVFLGLAIVLGYCRLVQRNHELAHQWNRNIGAEPVALEVFYADGPPTPGAPMRHHQGMAEYVFTSRLVGPVTLAFPPIGYSAMRNSPCFAGSFDSTQMPSFCFPARQVEIPSGGQVAFQVPYSFDLFGSGEPPCRTFVFGNPSGVQGEHLFLGTVVGRGVWGPRPSASTKK